MRIARIIVSQGSAEGNCAAIRSVRAGNGIAEAIASCHRVRGGNRQTKHFPAGENLLQDKSELLEDSCNTKDQRSYRIL